MCHCRPIRPCGAAYWCFVWLALGLPCPVSAPWRRDRNHPCRPNLTFLARMARARISAAAVRRMPTPMTKSGMVAARRVADALWERAMLTQVMNLAGAVVAMA